MSDAQTQWKEKAHSSLLGVKKGKTPSSLSAISSILSDEVLSSGTHFGAKHRLYETLHEWKLGIKALELAPGGLVRGRQHLVM